jgi:cytochrome c nitrite reductase small subunit
MPKFPGKGGGAFIAGFIVAVLCFVGLNAVMAPLSKPEYCGGKCHEMNPAYRTWELSTHGSNKHGFVAKCVDCHLPSKDEYFTHIFAKGYAGIKDTLVHHFGDEYDLQQKRQEVLEGLGNERCLGCHVKLLRTPSSSAAYIAHSAVLANPEAEENRCVKCHEQAGHQREKKLFSK